MDLLIQAGIKIYVIKRIPRNLRAHSDYDHYLSPPYKATPQTFFHLISINLCLINELIFRKIYICWTSKILNITLIMGASYQICAPIQLISTKLPSFPETMMKIATYDHILQTVLKKYTILIIHIFPYSCNVKPEIWYKTHVSTLRLLMSRYF